MPVNVRNFIQQNYTEYTGDGSFLAAATERTQKLMHKVSALLREEMAKGGVLDVDVSTASSLLNYGAGYIDKDLELIVGLQTDSPLKRGVNPFGGIKMARQACEAYGYTLSDEVENEFKYRTTHNDGVFRVYTDEMKNLRRAGVVTGLPDAYGRGRIIGDYRRVALYGVDKLIEEKQNDKAGLANGDMTGEIIKLSEELYQQISFLEKLKTMAELYGYDISIPARSAKEAVQWLYFGYLASIKEQNGAAMSLGRVSAFLDIYIEKDIKAGILDEAGAQELIDDFVIKLRLARHLRTPEYNELFGGDPMWITESLGGMGENGKSLVTKTTYRFIHTLNTLGHAPEPNLTVLWSQNLPESFKKYCAHMSICTNSLQYENDDLMRPQYGDDYGIACCVSAMKIGKQMQYFGARCNYPKLLLLALNGGIDERTGQQIAPESKVFGGVLKYGEVKRALNFYRKWLCATYVKTMNIIHYMHDKYAYEKTQMSLHDTDVERFMAFGVAGFSVITDSLSAIKHAKVTAVLNDKGYIKDFKTEGKFPKFGNDEQAADDIGVGLLKDFYKELCKNKTYRKAKHTLSVLTITSNVVYGQKTGKTPDGREEGAPFAPGANPMHGREENGALASLNSVSALPYEFCRDGISNTFSVTPKTLGETPGERVDNLVEILTGYFKRGAHHLNVNVLDKGKLKEAIDRPDKYPNLTVRVSGYAVNINKLSKEQQEEVLKRTYH